MEVAVVVVEVFALVDFVDVGVVVLAEVVVW